MLHFDVVNSGEDKVLVLTLSKNLDLKFSKEANRYLFPALLKHRVDKMILDLGLVKNINPAGYNMLYKINWALKITGGKMFLENVPEVHLYELKKMKFKILNKSYKEIINI